MDFLAFLALFGLACIPFLMEDRPMKTWKARMGHLLRVPNKNPRPGANRYYSAVRLQDEHGRETCLLFTDHELRRAAHRAARNPEDLLKAPWVMDCLD